MLCAEKTAQLKDLTAKMSRRICFVCTGNTCRSPMAAAVANAMAGKEPSPRLVAISAGLYAGAGDPITPQAVMALERAGVAPIAGLDYHTHTAHTVTEEEADADDLLVAMSGAHAMELLLRFPSAAHKITCMPQAISDPFGGDLVRYEQCLSEITEGVRALFFAEDAR